MTINCIKVENLQRANFKDAKVVPGDEISPFYLDVTYEFENFYGIYELHFPKIRMDMFFGKHRIPDVKKIVAGDPLEKCCFGTFSLDNFPSFISPYYGDEFGLPLGHVASNAEFEIIQIKEKEQEMTLEDIEKKLGHKVKIISKKKKD